ncbi:hypothetical protein GUJ93_ZPchr0592g29118 [Zizania palustris]|uniref:Exonuclease domain-containing protein n=1 Tax=Zizania palustris TaxID=103762 RepID=A0A8J5RQC5_ZIZPA|nr:hypothetical protein GUJ93_ZPchr0592g29118 [Zizania palustris]
MKMASLASYFGLGKQRHRSLDDVRMNLEVLKYCATVLFLEASLPEVLTVENLVGGAITRSQVNGAASPEVPKPEAKSSPDSSKRQRTVSRVSNAIQAGDNQQSIDPAANNEPVELISNMEEMKLDASTQIEHISTTKIACSNFVVPVHRSSFGVSTKFLDNAGRPKLNIVVDIPDNIREVLEFCDGIAQRSISGVWEHF